MQLQINNSLTNYNCLSLWRSHLTVDLNRYIHSYWTEPYYLQTKRRNFPQSNCNVVESSVQKFAKSALNKQTEIIKFGYNCREKQHKNDHTD